jgi:hypothetical protein
MCRPALVEPVDRGLKKIGECVESILKMCRETFELLGKGITYKIQEILAENVSVEYMKSLRMDSETPGADVVEDHLNTIAGASVSIRPLPQGRFPSNWRDNLSSRLDAIVPSILNRTRTASKLLVLESSEHMSNDPNDNGRIFVWKRIDEGWEFLHCECYPDRLSAAWHIAVAWPTLAKCFYRVLQYCDVIGDAASLDVIYANAKVSEELRPGMRYNELRDLMDCAVKKHSQIGLSDQERVPLQVAITHPKLIAFADILLAGCDNRRDMGIITSQIYDRPGISSLVADMMRLSSRFARHLPHGWARKSMDQVFDNNKKEEEEEVNVLQHGEIGPDIYTHGEDGKRRKSGLGHGVPQS